jgi:hypothetical protein
MHTRRLVIVGLIASSWLFPPATAEAVLPCYDCDLDIDQDGRDHEPNDQDHVITTVPDPQPGPVDEPIADDSCQFAFDGVCDEGAACPTGTDHTDCDANHVH